MSTNKRIRFMHNNLIETYSDDTTSSSANSTFPLANLSGERYDPFKFAGNFVIDSTNNTVYFNDGASDTSTITSGEYTASALATEIQTQLNTDSSGWTVSYSTSTYRFTISNTSSVTLELSSTSNAAWDTIGFTTSTDLTGTSFEGDAARIHTQEYITFDFGYNADITFLAILPEADGVLNFSDLATLTLKTSNVSGNWDDPAETVALTLNNSGIVTFLDSTETFQNRFVRIEIEDKSNADGPELPINYIFLGTYFTLDSININRQFSWSSVDPSETQQTISGAKYFFKRDRRDIIESVTFPFLEDDDYENIRDFIEDVGITERFVVTLDPLVCFSDDLLEFTRLVRILDVPEFSNNGVRRFSATMTLEEVV